MTRNNGPDYAKLHKLQAPCVYGVRSTYVVVCCRELMYDGYIVHVYFPAVKITPGFRGLAYDHSKSNRSKEMRMRVLRRLGSIHHAPVPSEKM